MITLINDFEHLRLALQPQGYGTFITQKDTRDGVEEDFYEIDYVPKTDGFIVEHVLSSCVVRYTADELMKSVIGKAIEAGQFYKEDVL